MPIDTDQIIIDVSCVWDFFFFQKPSTLKTWTNLYDS